MSYSGFLSPVRDFVDGLVHPSARLDALTTARHRTFIAPRLIGSLIALSVLPVYLIARGQPSALEIAVFAWLIVPILVAYFLSRTGRYEGAHILSSLSLTGLVTTVALMTGGISSFAAIWLVVVPLEAALSTSRRVVATASTFALAAAGLLLAARYADWLPADDIAAGEHGALAALGIISAALYATGVALGAEKLARMSVWLFHAEEDRYRLLARNMTDVITRHGKHGGIVFISPAAENLFGARVAQLRGHGLFERVHVADRPAYLTALSHASSSGEPQSLEFRVRSQDTAQPQYVWVEMRCRPVDPVEGQSERDVVSVMRDVTERKNQERALDMARAESDRANAAKTRFLATMSHELRTPLNAIIGFSDMLSNEVQMRLDAERRADYARLINDSGHHLLAVVNGILDMSKMETGDFELSPETFAPRDVIGNCCELLTLKANDSGVTIASEIPGDLPSIVADKRALKQIMINLIANAIKFTDRGGRVTVSALAETSRLAIAVEDTGIGISEADMARVGDPFFQAKSAYDRPHDGTGLGLSIVKGLVALHGGEFDLHSRVGKGTRITIRLPFDCEAKRAEPNVTHPDFSQTRRKNGREDHHPVKKSA